MTMSEFHLYISKMFIPSVYMKKKTLTLSPPDIAISKYTWKSSETLDSRMLARCAIKPTFQRLYNVTYFSIWTTSETNLTSINSQSIFTKAYTFQNFRYCDGQSSCNLLLRHQLESHLNTHRKVWMNKFWRWINFGWSKNQKTNI